MSARGSGHEQGDGWLGWDREAEAGVTGGDGADATTGDPLASDRAVETTGPWLRHDAGLTRSDVQAPGEPDDPSPWLAPETTVPDEPTIPDEPASSPHVPDTALPPTMAGAQSVPRWNPGRPTTPSPETLPAAHTQPVRVADTDPAAGDVEDAATGPSRRRRRGTERVDEPDEPARGLAVLGAAAKELLIVVGMALVLSFVVKTWLLQAFYIPSGSMEDTLRINDRVIVSKLTPGPFDLRRGDIIVFADPGDWVEAPVQQEHGTAVTVLRDAMMFVGLLPDDSENHLIKRVIGLPGDHVQCCDAGGRLTINGQPVKEPYLKPGVAPSDQNFDITVPRGRVWVMGDNRSGSSDSRFHDAPSDDGSLGSVDERLIVGRAVALVWPLDHLTWLSNPSSTFRNVPAPGTGGASNPRDPAGDGSGGDGSGGDGSGTEAPTTGGGTVDGGTGG